MKRRFTSVLAAAALIAVVSATPAGADPSFDGPGCHGAQLSSLAHFFGGVANAAAAEGVSVKDGQAFLREFFPCEKG
jgi:hypothetical protein